MSSFFVHGTDAIRAKELRRYASVNITEQTMCLMKIPSGYFVIPVDLFDYLGIGKIIEPLSAVISPMDMTGWPDLVFYTSGVQPLPYARVT